MDELKEQGKGKGLAMRKSWEEMRKGGSIAPTLEVIESILRTIIEQIQKTAQKILCFVFRSRTKQIQNLKSVV